MVGVDGIEESRLHFPPSQEYTLSLAVQYIVLLLADNSSLHPVADAHFTMNSSISSLLGSVHTLSGLTFVSSSSSNLCTIDVSSTLPIEFVSSVITMLGTVLVLDCVRDAIDGVISDMISGVIGLSCSIGSGVCAVFCCLCDGLSLPFFSHEEG